MSGFAFIINSILFGVGLAMDAFSVSMANGLHEPRMAHRKSLGIAMTFAIFQTIMPLLGYLAIHTIANTFKSFQKFIPFIALILLGYIGGKMLLEGIRHQDKEEESPALSYHELFIQGIATSIDALSVGFTIAEYAFAKALIESLIIGVVTFFICIIGLAIGKKFGTKLSSKASILGGVILIAIGLEIFITSFI